MLDIHRQRVAEVLKPQDWKGAFRLTGLSSQANRSKRLLDRLGLSSPPEVPSTLLTREDFQVILPAGKNIPLEEVMATVLDRDRRHRALRLPSRAKLPPLLV